MKWIKNLIFPLAGLLFFGCSVETDDPEEAFQYWSNSKVPEEIEVLEGYYYKSPHFTYEFEVFLKIKAEDAWVDELIERSNMSVDTVGNDWSGFTQLPAWFKPGKEASCYALDQHDIFDRTRIFKNSSTGICYIYDTLGM